MKKERFSPAEKSTTKHHVLIKSTVSGCDGKNWLSFQNPVVIYQTEDVNEVIPILEQVEYQVNHQDLFAAGFISYEAAPAFNPALHVRPLEHFPLIWFGLYQSPRCVSLPAPSTHQKFNWQLSTTWEEYSDAIDLIKENIARGYTYQVNYTVRLKTDFSGDPWELFLQLANAQRSDYAAFVDTGDRVLVSASPELFFNLNGEELISQPMKGTAPRGRTLQEDRINQSWLQGSEKNRAENVMIVDMIRNDMGKVAQTGSVKVSDLFQVLRFPTVWQMISTVKSRTTASYVDIMKAMFPCASITGAPKLSTMKIIAGLETSPRKSYTGAIGYFAPQRQAQFNVAIRTVLINVRENQAEYGVGGGIVWDSDNQEEYQECMIKALVLNAAAKEFSLLETIRWIPGVGYVFLEDHLRRMSEAVEYFSYPVDILDIRQALLEFAKNFSNRDQKVRVLVDRYGMISIESSDLTTQIMSQPVRLILASSPVDSSNPFLYHKTTYRKVYDEAAQNTVANSSSFDDLLLWNERGEVTETCIANLVYQLDEDLFTPPIDSGLLPGTFRSILLDKGVIREKVLPVTELENCKRLFVVNSVRGWRQAVLVQPGET